MRTLLITCVLTASGMATTPVVAQCTVKTVGFRSYGLGCKSVFTTTPTIVGAFQASSCRLQLQVGAYRGCCNTFLRNFIYVFGVAPANLPVPFIGPSCVLLTRQDLVVVRGLIVGRLDITLPKGIGKGTVYVQAAAQYFTTIGQYYSHNLTPGLAITLQ